MNVVTILGSPRKHGNTAKVLGLFEDEMDSGGHTMDRVNLIDVDVRGCLGCGTCGSLGSQI